MDIRDAVAYHMLLLSAEGASEATMRNYLFHERHLIDFFDAHKIPDDLDAITPALVRAAAEWYRAGQKPGLGTRDGQAVVRQFYQRIKTFVSRLESEGIMKDGTLLRLRPPRIAKVLRQPFTQTEVYALWSACQYSRNAGRDEALFLLLLDTGMRIGEATTLTTSQLHLGDRRAIVGGKGKGRRERLVPLGDNTKRGGGRVITALHGYLRVRPNVSTPNVFLTELGGPLTAVGASEVIFRLGKRARVPNAIPHRLRHTFATQYLVMFPGDEIGLRRIIGHVSHDVLADYAHFAQTTIAERAGRASLAEAWLSHPPRSTAVARQ